MRILLVCLLAVSLSAQDQQSEVIFRESVKYVIAPVIVTDRDNKFVNGLSPIDFRLLDNGKPQKITEDVASHPISLVVAIQASAAMEKILPQIRKSASLFDSLVLGENGEVAFLSFDHRFKELSPFTSDPATIKEALSEKNLKPGSASSRLNDAANMAIRMLKNRPSNRKKILLLISESRDIGSEAHVREVMTEAEFANVTVYSVDVSHLMTSLTGKTDPPRPSPLNPASRQLPGGYINTPGMEAQMQMGNFVPVFKEIFIAAKSIFIKNPLEVYTKYTGGREYSFMTQRGLEEAIADIGQELQSQYLLTYSPNNQGEAGFHDIEVQILKPGLKVRTRPGYWLAARPDAIP